MRRKVMKIHAHAGETGFCVYEHNGTDWYRVWQYGLADTLEPAQMVASGNMAATPGLRQRAFAVCQVNIAYGERSFYRCDLALDRTIATSNRA